MCYLVLLSTTSDEDLSAFNSELLQLSQEIPNLRGREKLKYIHQWYVGSKSGCSCKFRHLHSPDLGFDVPQDWYPETTDEIEATKQISQLIRRLVQKGESVDCLDIWAGSQVNTSDIKTWHINMSQIADEEFRFIENYYFSFSQ